MIISLNYHINDCLDAVSSQYSYCTSYETTDDARTSMRHMKVSATRTAIFKVVILHQAKNIEFVILLKGLALM